MQGQKGRQEEDRWEGKVQSREGQVVGGEFQLEQGVRGPRDSQRVGLAEGPLTVEMGLAGRRYLSHTDCWKPH